MFAKLRARRSTSSKTQDNQENKSEDENEKNKQGFICPMCMAALPGPAELQIHFEKVHNESDEKLLDHESDTDEIDALPESSEDLLATAMDFTKTQLDFSLDANAPDTDKEVFLLQQELADLTAALKEEKWYTSQLKQELDQVAKERDKLEEEKVLVEDEYAMQLRSAEQGYLQVVEENKELKNELTFADYGTTKERTEKMKQELIGYQNKAEEEQARREALESNFKLLQAEYQRFQQESIDKDNQLNARPSSRDIDELQAKVNTLNESLVSVQQSNKHQVEELEKKYEEDTKTLRQRVSELNVSIRELTLVKDSKDAQIASLQTAIDNSRKTTEISGQQNTERQQQINELSEKLKSSESNGKIKEEKVIELNLALASEVKEKESTLSQLHTTKTSNDNLNHQVAMLQTELATVEEKALQQKEEVIRLEKERVELITKIEAGEGTDTVIQQLTQEKSKLMDAITVMEKSKQEQMERHREEMNMCRVEKNKMTEELRLAQQSLSKAQLHVVELENKTQTLDQQNSLLKEQIKGKDEKVSQVKLESNSSQARLQGVIDEKILFIQSLEKEMVIVKERLSRASEDLQHSENDKASWIETKNKSISEMTSKLTQLKEQLNIMNAENATLKKQIGNEKISRQNLQETLEAKSKTFEEEMKEANAKLQNISSKLETVVEEKNKCEQMIKELSEQKEVFELLQTELGTKQDDQTKLIEDLSVHVKKTEDLLDSTRKEHELTIETLKTTHSAAFIKLEKERDLISEDLQHLKTNTEDEIKKRNTAENQILEWETKHARLVTVLEQKDAVLNDVQSKLEVVEKELKKSCNSCKNYEIQLCRLQEATKDQSGQISSLKEKIMSLENAIQVKEEELADANGSHQTLTDEMETTIAALNDEIKTYKSEVTDLKASVLSSTEEVQKLSTTVEELTISKQLLSSSLEDVKVEKDQIETARLSLDKELLDVKVDIQMKTEEIEKLTAEYKAKEMTLTSKADILQSELAEIHQDLLKEQEAHQQTKITSEKVQNLLKEETKQFKTQQEKHRKDLSDLQQLKVGLERRLTEQITTLQQSKKKLEEDLLSRERLISEYEIKLKTAQTDADELKGDVTVLEAQLQNNIEEKKALLERVLSIDDQLKKAKQEASDANRRLNDALAGLQELGQENQNLQVQQVLKSTREWEKDGQVTSCKKCEKQFTMTVRKHHCRHCGLIFCKDCSAYQAVVAASKKPVRVCQPCSVELSSLRGSNVRRLSNSSLASVVSNR